MKPTIKDVAACAGVSVGTVSKILNGGECAPKRREKIDSAIKTLGYRLNPYARAVRASRSNCIGLVIEKSVQEMSNLWLDGWLSSLLQSISGTRYRSIVMTIDSKDPGFDPEELIHQVDGIITFGHFFETFRRKLKPHREFPMVTYSEDALVSGGWSFPVDMKQAMAELAEAFYSRGHRHVGCIGVNYDINILKMREFEAAFRRLHPDYNPELMVVAPAYANGTEIGKQETARLLDEHPETSAILYITDSNAIGGIAALMHRRMSVPEDISIASYDHTAWARNMYPVISGVGMDFKTLAQLLVDYLIAVIEEKHELVEELRKEKIHLKYFPGDSIKNLT